MSWREIKCRGKVAVTKKSEKKKSKKNSQLVLRLDKVQRDEFVQLCNEMDTSAAREIRRFIREFMKEHGETETSKAD